MKISYVTEHPQEFGCVLIVPEPRPNKPWGPFNVKKAVLSPGKPQGTLTVSLSKEGGWTYGGAHFERGDCLIHVPSGALACVTARLTRDQIMVEGWAAPEGEADQTKWMKNPGTGQWVVWGTAFRDVNDLPRSKRPEIIAPEDTAEARRQMSRFPDRLPWQQAGFNVGTNPRKLKGKAKKRFRQRMRKLLGGLHLVETIEDLDAHMEKHQVTRRKAQDGKGEWIKWRLGPDPAELKRRLHGHD